MTNLSNEDQKYFDDMFELFTTEGWKALVAKNVFDKDQAIQVLAYGRTGIEDTWFIKGQIAVADTIIKLEETIDMAYKNATEPQEEEDDEETL